MKTTHLRLLTALVSFAFAIAAGAAWVAEPIDVTVETPSAATAFSTTGTVTLIAAPAAGTSYFLSSVSCSAMLPGVTGTHDAAATGTVTIVESPPAGESYALTRLSCHNILPALPTNTLTVSAGAASYVFTNNWTERAAAVTVTNGTAITMTLSPGVTNLPTVTFWRTWSPDTNTVTLTFAEGTITNTVVATNTTPAAASFRVTENATITAELSASVTNLPSIYLTRIVSPAVTNITLYGSDQRRMYGARIASGVIPDDAGTNSVSVEIVYYGGPTEAWCTLTNGAPAYEDSTPPFILPLDAIRITALGATNSPSVRIPAERWKE